MNSPRVSRRVWRSQTPSASSSMPTTESSGSDFVLDPTAGSTTVIIGDANGAAAVGLTDPSSTGNRRAMLQLINRLRDTGVQTEIDLPMIAVIGIQSAGKSSLIESICGVTLPRSSGTCTRCPTECKISQADAPWKCLVKLHFSTDARGLPIPVTIVSFGAPITSRSEVEERIRCAQRAILNPSKDPKEYLTRDAFPDDNEVSFSKNYVSLEISGPGLTDLSFVDLPGLIASVGKGGNDRDIELVKSLVTSYIEKPSCVILLTVACETDFENQGAHHLAKQYDPDGKRTVGVLTKPDRIPPGDEAPWVRILRNETEPLENNWYCVKQPSSQEVVKGITYMEARRREDEWFSSTRPWSTLEAQYQSLLRTSCLTERLSHILSELISDRLPTIEEDLANAIQQTERKLRSLPKAPSSDPVGEVLQALKEFVGALDRRVEGTPEPDGLLQTIHPHHETFKTAIRRTAPMFVPYERGSKKELSEPTFLANEDGDRRVEGTPDPDGLLQMIPPLQAILGTPVRRTAPTFPDERASKKELSGPTFLANEDRDRTTRTYLSSQNKIYIDEVLKRAQDARTRELPDNYPFVVQHAYIKEITQKWTGPAMVLFDRTYAILKADVARLVTVHFAHMGGGNAKQAIQRIVNEHLEEAAQRTKQKIEWLLDLEQNPTTLNTHYFTDYKDKFLAHYKAAREDGDLAAKLRDDSTVKDVVSRLHEIGIPAKAADLSKLLPPDPNEPALHIMAGVRAYFQVAYKRFVDMVPMMIDHEIVLGVQKEIYKALSDGLQITGRDAYARCKGLLEERVGVVTTRREAEEKMQRLQAARQELRGLM